MAKNDAILIAKRKRLAHKIKELAPEIDVLSGMLSEMQVDIMLIAIDGARLEHSEIGEE